MDPLSSSHFASPRKVNFHPAAQRIAVFVSGDSSAFDVSTIATIFSCANRLNGKIFYEVTLVGYESSVICAEGIMLSTMPLEQWHAPTDTLFMTGNALDSNVGAAQRHALMETIQRTRQWCAIDSGVIALASLGLLSRRQVSVRDDISRLLVRRHPEVNINEQKLFTRDGNLWSCPSGTPVVDLCLTMVEQDFGRRIANCIAHALLVPGRRSGDQPQISPILRIQSCGGRDRPLAALVDWINQNVNTRIDIPMLAARVSMSERNFHRRFKAYTGQTPAEYINNVRADHARQFILAEVSLKEVAGYAGFASPSIATRALKRTERSHDTDQVKTEEAA